MMKNKKINIFCLIIALIVGYSVYSYGSSTFFVNETAYKLSQELFDATGLNGELDSSIESISKSGKYYGIFTAKNSKTGVFYSFCFSADKKIVCEGHTLFSNRSDAGMVARYNIVGEQKTGSKYYIDGELKGNS